MNDAQLRELVPAVIGVLVRRGADFASAEDAVQEALVRALATWPDDPPLDPKGWLVTVAWHRFVDDARSQSARRVREEVVHAEPAPGPVPTPTTRSLYFLCAHPALTAPSAVALTLRAVGGLTTAQIAERLPGPGGDDGAADQPRQATPGRGALDQPGDLATVLRVLYLVFNEGYGGDVDLAAEAIRLTRQLTAADGRAGGRRAARADAAAPRPARRAGRRRRPPRPARPSRTASLWDTELIAEGVAILQAALARDRLGEYQAQAAIAALHADARSAEETDWVQIVEWYDELVRLTDSPIVRLNRAVAVGEADGPLAGLALLADLDPDLPRYAAVEAHLRERAGELERAARLYAEAARAATSEAERDHLIREAARVRQVLSPR